MKTQVNFKDGTRSVSTFLQSEDERIFIHFEEDYIIVIFRNLDFGQKMSCVRSNIYEYDEFSENFDLPTMMELSIEKWNECANAYIEECKSKLLAKDGNC